MRRGWIVALVLLLLLVSLVGLGVQLLVHEGEAPADGGADDPGVVTASAATGRGARKRDRERVRAGDPAAGTVGGDVTPQPGESGAAESGSAEGGTPAAEAGSDERDGDSVDGSPGQAGGGGEGTEAAAARDQRVVRTRITDSATRYPVAGACVLLAYVVGEGGVWYGGTTGEDGRETHRLPEDFGGEEGRYEMRVGRRGYEYKIVPMDLPELGESKDVDVTLTALDHLPVPGRLVVYATRPDGTPITGIVLVGGSDGLDGIWQWGVADSSGTAVLEGVPSGHWTLRLEESGHRTETILPDDGETRVHLVGPDMEWPGDLWAVGYELLRDQIQTEMREPEQADSAVYALQQLDTRWRAVADRREVIVAGLPTDGPAWLRAQPSGPQNFWRVRIRDAEAHFPGLTLDDWSFRIERPGEQTKWKKFEITEGDGPQRISLTDSE